MAAERLSPPEALEASRGREERGRKSVEGGRGGAVRRDPHHLFTPPFVASSASTSDRHSPASRDKSVSALQSYWLNPLLPFHYAVQWAAFCNRNNSINNNSDNKQSDNNSVKANTRGNLKKKSFCCSDGIASFFLSVLILQLHPAITDPRVTDMNSWSLDVVSFYLFCEEITEIRL